MVNVAFFLKRRAVAIHCALLLLTLSAASIVAAKHPLHPISTPSGHLKIDSLPNNADEISVSLSLAHVGTTVVPALLIDKTVYIPIMEVLDFVKVKSELSVDRTKITGFFIDESQTYVIDIQDRNIRKGLSRYVLTPTEMIVTESGYYLRSDMYRKAFGMDCDFNFKLLDVKITCDRELPAVADALRKKSAMNLSGAAGEEQIDRRFPLRRPILKAGVLDWTLSSSLSQGIHTEQYTLALGGDLLGGDIDARYSGSPQVPTDMHSIGQQLLWRWRYVTNGSTLLTQAMVGTISSQATSALADSVIGLQLSNKPIQYGSSFANYTIRDKTEPGWTVELYVNDALVKFVKADDAGNYTLAIPISYGATSVKLKFYGPWGEVQTKNIELRIPYTFLPPGKLEYTFTAGMNKNTLNFRQGIAQLNLDAGISTLFTVGGGVKYYNQPGLSPFAPFASVSSQLINNLLVNAQYIVGTGVQGTMSYSTNSGISLEGLYDHPFANPRFGGVGTAQDQRRLTLGMPVVPLEGSLSLSVMDIQQTPTAGALSLNSILSAQLYSLPISLNTSASFQRDGFHLASQGLTGAIATSLLVPFSVLVRPSMQFDYLQRKFVAAGVAMQRSFGSNGQISMDVSRNFQANSWGAHVDIHYALPWVQLGAQAGVDGGAPSIGSTAQGSLIFDGGTNEVVLSDRNFVDRGGIMVRPFLDVNNNGFYDFGEPLVKNFRVSVNGGRVVHQNNGILRVMDLDPYVTYVLKNSTEGVENLAWVSKFQSYAVTVDANAFSEVNVPITVAGQIGGTIRLASHDGPAGQGGIVMKVKNRFGDGKEIKMPEDFMSYSSGEFYNIGLTPGKYQIYPDPEQMKRLRLKADPPIMNFELHSSPDGDIIDTLNFLVTPEGAPDTTSGPASTVKSPASVSNKIEIREIALGQEATKTLQLIGKPKDALKYATLSSGYKMVTDTLAVGECALAMTRTLSFDDKNLLRAMSLNFRGHDVNKLMNQDCILYWLTAQYGYPQQSTKVDNEKQYRWQLGFTQINLETKQFGEAEYTFRVSYTKTGGK